MTVATVTCLNQTTMTFQESLEYLDSFLNLERIQFQKENPLWNLARMRFLLKAFKHPEKHFLPVLIAGTKGKGSSGFFLEAILAESKIPVGFYSSPHLETPLERVRLGGRQISSFLWCETLSEIQRGLKQNPLPRSLGSPTYFEVMTLLAALVFRKQKVRVGIFEVGLGGRLDATNVFRAPVVMITAIDLDHEKILGDTIAKIAAEKAAIIKSPCRVVLAPQKPEALRVIHRRIKEMKARVFLPLDLGRMKLGLKGEFQKTNAGLALRAALLLRNHYRCPVTSQGILLGFERSSWPGRLELFQKEGFDFLLDGAHNPASAKVLTEHLQKEHPKRKRILIFGTSRDKNFQGMFKAFCRYFDEIILTRAKNPRAQDHGPLLGEARHHFKRIYAAANSKEAIALARQISNRGTLVVLTGSFYLLGEVRGWMKKGGRFA